MIVSDANNAYLQDEIEAQRPSKKFHLVEAAESKVWSCSGKHLSWNLLTRIQDITASPSAVQYKDNLTHATETGVHVLPQSAPVELPLHPLGVTSSLLSAALAAADHSRVWNKHDNDDKVAVDFAMSLPVHNIRATDLAKLLGTYDPYDDLDDEERFGEPREDFHSYIYEMIGLYANGEEVTESGEEADSSGDEFDSDEEDESGYASESGDEEIDRASLIGDDEEKDEWEEHEYSEAELDAEEGIAVSGDEENEETESEGEDEIKR